jgi:hypothetical protein
VHHRFGSRGILQRCSLPHDLRRRGGGSRPPFVDEAKISRCTAHRDPIVVMERLEHPRAVGLDRVGPREPIRPVHPRRFVIPGIRPRSLEPPELAIEIHVRGVVGPSGSEIQLGASGGNPEGLDAMASRMSFSNCLSIARCTGVSSGFPSGEGANFEMNSERSFSLP